MSYQGIDYGLGKTNIDTKTGIRYGVISQHSILQAWADSSEPCWEEGEEQDEDTEPAGYAVDAGEYLAESCLDNDVLLVKSPYYTFTQFCSPCVPGAGNLDLPIDEGVKTYAFGHDWFESDKAPYRVYRVSDDVEVFS